MSFAHHVPTVALALWILLWGQNVQAVCLNPLGCAPKNYPECVADATSRQTELGVRMAAAQCYAKWKKPEDDRRAAEAAKLADARALAWSKAPAKTSTARALIATIGQPSMVLGAHACTPRNKFQYDVDFYGLRRQGRSDRSILEQLRYSERMDFDLDRARRDGYSDSTIVDSLSRLMTGSTFDASSKTPVNKLCYTYLWQDGRAGRVDAYFRAEFLADEIRTVWGYWRYSLENFEL